MPDQAPDPHAQMLQMITGYWVTQIVRGAAAVSLADQLADGPKPASELSSGDGGALHPVVANRFLRACAAVGLVAPTPDGTFASTPLLATLRRDDPGSMRGMALALGAPGHWLPWGRFPDALAAGRRQTIEALGSELFDYYAANPGESADFSRAMTGITAIVVREAVRVLDTAGVRTVIDVGGAEGALLRGLLESNPQLRGIVLDRADVIDRARTAVNAAGLGPRVDIVAGDFFAEIPAGDLYLLKHILHDWDDDACLTILRNCRKAASAGGRVAIIEVALDDVDKAGFGALMDLNMLALGPGKERTFAEYEALLRAAGFGDARLTPTATPMIVIEAVAA